MAEMTEDPPVRCPMCSVLMRRITKKGIDLDVCQKCRGTWFDAGELRALTKKKIDPRPLEGSRSELSCPRCDDSLSLAKDAKANIVVHACKEHGAFLPSEELRTMASAGLIASAELIPSGSSAPIINSDVTEFAAETAIETGAEIAIETVAAMDGSALDAIGDLAGNAIDVVGDLFSSL